MATEQLRQESAVLVDGKTIVVTYAIVRPAPPPPEWISEDRWYLKGIGGDRVVLSANVANRIVSSMPMGIAAAPGPDGSVVYTRYTWNGTAWANPVPCDGNGDPL